jgi:hypothetical protein
MSQELVNNLVQALLYSVDKDHVKEAQQFIDEVSNNHNSLFRPHATLDTRTPCSKSL